eukprot:819878-Rhodomonas_salina.1
MSACVRVALTSVVPGPSQHPSNTHRIGPIRRLEARRYPVQPHHRSEVVPTCGGRRAAGIKRGGAVQMARPNASASNSRHRCRERAM